MITKVIEALRDQTFRIPIRWPLTGDRRSEWIDVYFSGRTEVEQLCPLSDSELTGLLDWQEIFFTEDECWQIKEGGRTGSFEECTAAVEYQFGNMAIEGTIGRIKKTQKKRVARSPSSSSCILEESGSLQPSSSSIYGGFAYVTDQVHTNQSGSFFEI